MNILQGCGNKYEIEVATQNGSKLGLYKTWTLDWTEPLTGLDWTGMDWTEPTKTAVCRQ